MSENRRTIKKPDQLISYFRLEKWTLVIVSISGIIYNVGMTAGPWFEGKLAQYLCDIIGGSKHFKDMLRLALSYVLVILLVQAMRYVKRLYIRKFANHINRDMKQVLYRSLVHKEKQTFERESVGMVMTKAISDVDTCVEGMRKFTTEIFDTGVVMAAYLVMLILYDWRLTLLSMIFPPFAYVIAEKLKSKVAGSAAAFKESTGRLNSATMDRVGNAVTYRVYGQEENQAYFYEKSLYDYEQKAIRANIWETAMQPLYQILSMLGVIFILWFGAKNVLGSGWTNWDIAAFTTFLSCFTKLAVKSSKAAKLFNAVQKAQVSWKRIKPFMQTVEEDAAFQSEQPASLSVKNLCFGYPGGKELLRQISFMAYPGEIIGVTGAVASGKSTLGKIFLCEYPYQGSIQFGTKELSMISTAKRSGIIGYMGHEPELLSSSIEENILLGAQGNVEKYLKAVCMEQEVKEMPEGVHTCIGNGGIRLSGGQQARIALARTLCHKKPLIILDDPFSAVDQKTEFEIMKNLRKMTKNCIVIIISHRLSLFPQMNQVIWLEEGRAEVSDHAGLMQKNGGYAQMYRMQTAGGEEIETS